jgi:putative peptidoglycan lipid II flippase
VLYLATALTLIGPLGAVGLALANAVQNSSHAIILLVLLQRSLPGLRLWSALLPFLARVLPATAVIYALIALTSPALSGLSPVLALVAAAGLALVVYIGLLTALRVDEVHAGWRLVRQRLRA